MESIITSKGNHLSIFSMDELMTGKGRKFLSVARENLIESLTVAQYRYCGDERPVSEIIEECINSPYWDEHTMPISIYDHYLEDALKAISNVLKISKTVARKEFSWYWLFAGFRTDHYKNYKRNEENCNSQQ